MRRVIVNNNITLDGVMQAPARADEDPRDGFQHGGWAIPYNDAVKMQEMGKGMYDGSELLFGRRTYEDFYKVWPNRTDNPFTPVLDNTRKCVTSTTLKEPLPWKNSTLLAGDAAQSVAALKATPGGNLVVLGSGALVQTLLRHELVDDLVLLIHPLVLGSGRRLFADRSAMTKFSLVHSVPTTKGVLIATYKRTET